MKKLLSIFLLSFVLILAACGSDEPEVKEEPKKEEKPKTEEVVKKEEKKEKPADTKLELSESKVSFTNYTIEIKEAKLKENQLTLDTLYTNDSFDGEKSFMAAGRIEVYQNGEALEEVSGIKDNPNSNYFYKNAVGIWAPVEFVYELSNNTDEIEVLFSPQDWNEEGKKITISLQ